MHRILNLCHCSLPFFHHSGYNFKVLNNECATCRRICTVPKSRNKWYEDHKYGNFYGAMVQIQWQARRTREGSDLTIYPFIINRRPPRTLETPASQTAGDTSPEQGC